MFPCLQKSWFLCGKPSFKCPSPLTLPHQTSTMKQTSKAKFFPLKLGTVVNTEGSNLLLTPRCSWQAILINHGTLLPQNLLSGMGNKISSPSPRGHILTDVKNNLIQFRTQYIIYSISLLLYLNCLILSVFVTTNPITDKYFYLNDAALNLYFSL